MTDPTTTPALNDTMKHHLEPLPATFDDDLRLVDALLTEMAEQAPAPVGLADRVFFRSGRELGRPLMVQTAFSLRDLLASRSAVAAALIGLAGVGVLLFGGRQQSISSTQAHTVAVSQPASCGTTNIGELGIAFENNSLETDSYVQMSASFHDLTMSLDDGLAILGASVPLEG